MANIQNLTHMGKGRIKGSKNKLKWSDIITDERLQNVIEGLYDIALNDKYAKNRIAASNIIIDRSLGKIPQEINQTITESKSVADVLEENEEL